VWAEVCLHTEENVNALESALEQAQYIETTTLSKQLLNLAQWIE